MRWCEGSVPSVGETVASTGLNLRSGDGFRWKASDFGDTLDGGRV